MRAIDYLVEYIETNNGYILLDEATKEGVVKLEIIPKDNGVLPLNDEEFGHGIAFLDGSGEMVHYREVGISKKPLEVIKLSTKNQTITIVTPEGVVTIPPDERGQYKIPKPLLFAVGKKFNKWLENSNPADEMETLYDEEFGVFDKQEAILDAAWAIFDEAMEMGKKMLLENFNDFDWEGLFQ